MFSTSNLQLIRSTFQPYMRGPAALTRRRSSHRSSCLSCKKAHLLRPDTMTHHHKCHAPLELAFSGPRLQPNFRRNFSYQNTCIYKLFNLIKLRLSLTKKKRCSFLGKTKWGILIESTKQCISTLVTFLTFMNSVHFITSYKFRSKQVSWTRHHNMLRSRIIWNANLITILKPLHLKETRYLYLHALVAFFLEAQNWWWLRETR